MPHHLCLTDKFQKWKQFRSSSDELFMSSSLFHILFHITGGMTRGRQSCKWQTQIIGASEYLDQFLMNLNKQLSTYQ